MIIAYELSMPNNNAWNGRWSGEGRCYAIVRSVGNSMKVTAKYRKIAADGPYSYNFGDGWRASVTARIVDRAEAAKLRKRSEGFRGYDWMVRSIERLGFISSEVT